ATTQLFEQLVGTEDAPWSHRGLCLVVTARSRYSCRIELGETGHVVLEPGAVPPLPTVVDVQRNQLVQEFWANLLGRVHQKGLNARPAAEIMRRAPCGLEFVTNPIDLPGPRETIVLIEGGGVTHGARSVSQRRRIRSSFRSIVRGAQ